MKNNTSKSSITLPVKELALVEGLRRKLKAKSKVEVVRRGLLMLRDSVERDAIRAKYQHAARAVRQSTLEEVRELDALSSEGLDDE